MLIKQALVEKCYRQVQGETKKTSEKPDRRSSIMSTPVSGRNNR